MLVFKSWWQTVAARIGYVVFVGVGVAACSGGSSSTNETGDPNLTKPVSAQLDFDYLARQESGLFLIAGSIGGPGTIDGNGSLARFNQPTGIAFDGHGNMVVADSQNHVIRKIDKNGEVSTLAGKIGESGSNDGNAPDAHFSALFAIASDQSGNLYVTDRHAIRKLSSDGSVVTLAGEQNSSGFLDGSSRNARFNQAQGIAADNLGNIYVADTGNHAIRKITPDGTVRTLAGNPGNAGLIDGNGMQARFNHPAGISVDSVGNLYVADRDNRVLRKISPDGTVTTVGEDTGLFSHTAVASAPMQFQAPQGIVVDANGTLYVTDSETASLDGPCVGSGIIRRISPSGQLMTLAGTSKVCGSNDGLATNARFNLPVGIAVSPSGEILVADTHNHAIRKITDAGLVSTVAGMARVYGHVDGAGDQAQFGMLTGMAADRSGNLYVGDHSNTFGRATAMIRKISSSKGVQSITGNNGSGYADGNARDARFDNPSGFAVDHSGNLYIADAANAVIRKLAPDGAVSTYAGLAGSRSSDDGFASVARFHYPTAIAGDRQGNLYVTDVDSDQYGIYSAAVRKISANGFVSTLAGRVGDSGTADGPGTSARFIHPSGIAVDQENNIYLSDSHAHTVRRISSDGLVMTMAGNPGVAGNEDGVGRAAQFNSPAGLAADENGNIYIADRLNHSIRMLDREGKVVTLAGVKTRQGIALGEFPAGLSEPNGIAFLAPKLFAVTSGGSILGLKLP